MPRFTKAHKDSIHTLLLEKGEELFIKYGLKKVSIDDISIATGISHGAFYGFYKNKEHLFMTINLNNQKKIFDRMHKEINENKALDQHELTLRIFTMTFELFSKDKIITQINAEVYHQLSRKLPDSVLDENIDLDTEIVNALIDSGVVFKYDTLTVVKMIQALFISNIPLLEAGEHDIIQLLFEAVTDKIVIK